VILFQQIAAVVKQAGLNKIWSGNQLAVNRVILKQCGQCFVRGANRRCQIFGVVVQNSRPCYIDCIYIAFRSVWVNASREGAEPTKEAVAAMVEANWRRVRVFIRNL
jgi:hypothetical protein